MSFTEIPLLRNSKSYSHRLKISVKGYGGGTYHLARRVNWSYRYSDLYYQREAQLFTKQPAAYLSLEVPETPEVEDVYAKKLSFKDILRCLLKVSAHWLFLVLGTGMRRRAQRKRSTILRKGYVDDVELVYDPDADGVLRLVFPFPLGVKRQYRYVARLCREKRDFALCGVPYAPGDILQLLRYRTVGTMERMETRAQIRLAKYLARFPARKMELSDEYDIGCLDFCRTLHRFGFHVTNSAHGVGTYLPVHAFDRFSVLTSQQESYYHALRSCEYVERRLNAPLVRRPSVRSDDPVMVVMLGQAVPHVSQITRQAERDLLDRLGQTIALLPDIKVFYKPHPNMLHGGSPPDGVVSISDLKGINGHPKAVFCSFYSTCQIDPSFVGRKYLIRTPLIHPEIIYGDSELILTTEEFITQVIKIAKA